MTTALVFISLTLNILALLTIVVLYQRQNKFFDMEKKQQAMMKEMEDLISTYLAEMKEENEQFILSVSKVKEQKKPVELVKVTPKEDVVLPSLPQYKGSISHAAKAYGAQRTEASDSLDKSNEMPIIPIPMMKSEPVLEMERNPEPKPVSIEDRALLLKKQGYTLEEIAKLLERGRTEIELLLKFRQEPED